MYAIQEDLVPHCPILLLFATSAQTHIFPEIRLDAIRFLDIFLEHIPHAVVDGWDGDSSDHGARILEGYLGFLSAAPKETDGMIPFMNVRTILTKTRPKIESTREMRSGSVVLSPAVHLLPPRQFGERLTRFYTVKGYHPSLVIYISTICTVPELKF
jgi:pre-rRNA-processing protein IPI1